MRHTLSACGIRIIPAYAGSTDRRPTPRVSPADHPRIRGEHVSPSSRMAMARGSSPHTRGAPMDFRDPRVVSGIIPAYAGSTVDWTMVTSRVADHPRIRGEHATSTATTNLGNGSSPHTRGAHRLPLDELTLERIIPAYAGSTCRRSRQLTASADHPRIRGEHEMTLHKNGLVVGSSPHTRGAPLPPSAPPRRLRIIPAYAGSTDAAAVAIEAPPDHPRIRGEHDSRAA